MDTLPGWPDRTILMLTSAGTQIFEFRPGDDEVIEVTQFYNITFPAELRLNRLLGVEEKGGYFGDLNSYYAKGFYPVINTARSRVTDCLLGKGGENFAENKNPL